MTDFLKKVVANKLAMLGINPDMWVSDKFTEEEKQRRGRTRKKSTPSILDTDESTGMDAEEASENGNNASEDDENDNLLKEDMESDADSAEAMDVSVATSSVNERLTRSLSARQAAKRALSPVNEELKLPDKFTRIFDVVIQKHLQ